MGFGYDVHRLEAGIPFWLGGVEIPHEKGAYGHSDADVLIHALCDALLGAAALGDIGTHFPDTDPAFKGIAGSTLLKRTGKLLSDAGFRVVNVDATVCLQEPRIKEHIPEMRKRIATVLDIPAGRVSVKATTEEFLGFTGRKEGVSAHAVALLSESEGHPSAASRESI